VTEQQIERAVEIRMNALDRRLMEGSLQQNGYDQLVKSLADWADAEYAKLPKRKEA
jgi:hypothetical protein